MQVVVAVFPHHDGPQFNGAEGGLAGNENAGQKPTDAAETVEHNVPGWGGRYRVFVAIGIIGGENLCEFGAEECHKILGLAMVVAAAFRVADRQGADVDGCGGGVEGGQCLDDGEGLCGGELGVSGESTIAVGFDDVDIGDTHEDPAKDRGNDVVIVMQVVEQGEHFLRGGEFSIPIWSHGWVCP